MARKRLVAAQPVSLGDAARRKLIEHGVPEGEATWLASAVLGFHAIAEDIPYSNADGVDLKLWCLEETGKLWKHHSDRDSAVGWLLDTLAFNHLPTPGRDATPDQVSSIQRLRSFVKACQGHGVNFGAAFRKIRDLRPGNDSAVALRITRRFALLGALTAREMVSRENLLKLADRPDWWDFQPGYGDSQDHLDDPESLHLWLEIEGPAAAEHFLEDVDQLEPSEFLRLARALAYSFGVWPRFENHIHPEFFAERGPNFAALCRRVFEEADRRVVLVEVAPDELRHVWLRFAWMAIDATSDWIADECRSRLLRAAADDIGRLRPLLRRAHTDDAAELKRLEPHFRSCLFLLFKLGSLWQATKPLLLAFRATGTRSVGLDLRYWRTQQPDNPPTPWELVPRSLMNMLHHYFGNEQAGDPELNEYRTEFALFCLERLKSRRNREGVQESIPVEEDPVWREGFIQAARALRVNPKGKGHHILHWVATNDPDDAVRDVAKEAYAELRHQPSLPKGFSPRRAVFDAFWWLRQAHVASLGETVDQQGASQTREEEARRTTTPTSE